MIFEILSIGDEILSGNILNSNAQYLSDQLWQLGFAVEYHTSVRDDEPKIIDALERAASRADAVIVTGGLGPTVDDFTIEVAAKTFGVELEQDQGTVDHLTQLLQRKGRVISQNNLKQAMIPKGARILFNKVGTAPGVYFKFKETHFYFLPGVPREMKQILKDSILPQLDEMRTDHLHFKTAFLRTFGCAESELDNRLKDLMQDRMHTDKARIGFRAHFPEVFIKVSVWGSDEVQAEKDLQVVVNQIFERVGEFIYSTKEASSLEKEVVDRLTLKNKTVAVAESCTGGLIAHRLTEVSGASQVFLGGLVTYSNQLKREMLKVPSEILENQGAVSEECALAMVEGLHKKTNADYCVAVTGIAGPTGGSEEKPVGTVFVALKSRGQAQVQKHYLPFSRRMFKEVVAAGALKKIWDQLK